MSDDNDNGSDLRMHVGKLDGRLGALEDRVGRHEAWIGAQISELSRKLEIGFVDQRREIAALTADQNKQIADIVRQQNRGGAAIDVFKWIGTAVIGLSGWFLFWKETGHPPVAP